MSAPPGMLWDGVHHPSGCGCYRCIGARTALGFSPKFEEKANPPKPSTRTLHHIGRVQMDRYIYRKRKHYELLVDGVLVATSADFPNEAFRKARIKFPKQGQRVHGEIFAYRGWGLCGDILTPLSRREDIDTWKGPVATADRKPDDYDSDSRWGSDSYGLYAAKMQYSRHVLSGYYPPVHGIVGLFGRVVEHEQGYRAEKQIIRVLRVVPPVGELVLKALEERYQCQVFRQKKQQFDTPF